MNTLTFIVGLPGSGKTHLADQIAIRDGGTVIDDISIDTDKKLGIDANHLIVTDPNACMRVPELVIEKLGAFFGDRTITVIAFENDIDRCWANITARNDGRHITHASIVMMAQNYNPSAWGDDVRPVWTKETVQ